MATTITATVLQGPFSHSASSSNPILSWYAKYAADFAHNKGTTPPTNYYASTATLVHTDNSTISGAQQIWDYYISLYGQFEKCSYELISAIVLNDDQSGKHTLLVQVKNLLHLEGDRGTVTVPQAFTYEIAKAEDGSGTDGLQIWQIRCYFDRGFLQKAASV
ncbi:hypothetical protein BGW36DRAFT_361108 [Talaromyces proteolyticus]|uniref:SnoaL-like domain-containing protein n=1 Tax=Talaromyces proteolyticus TaxID=1131652 RepID=A0AAD4PUS0_9EURO|nr:uncharacterized protein BGW36DRAFT_361108 [Talaromyces proteolyticus]KAH8695411.1 hypothetical protein BGW36DRAFT_361108 [Talaromyces proteolyticus]